MLAVIAGMSIRLVNNRKVLALLLLSAIIISAVIFTSFRSFLNIEKTAIDQLRDNQLTKTEYAASRIENHVLEVRNGLVTLSKFPIMSSLDVNQCNGNIKDIHEKIELETDVLLRVDSEGNIVECSSPKFSDYLGMNVRNKDYFRIPKEIHEPFIYSMVRHGESKQIMVSVPLFETAGYTPYPNFIGKFNGVLLSVIELNNLYHLYIHPLLDTDNSYFLLINLDTDETILRSDSMRDYSEIKASLPSADSFNTITSFGSFGDTIITSSNLVLGSEKWMLIFLTPLKNVNTEILSVQKRHLLSLGSVILIVITAFLFLVFFYRSKEEVQLKLDKANVTLDKLGIKIETEQDRYNLADVSLDAKKVYLVKEDDENHAHELFISSLNRGFAGLGIVRENPRTIKDKYNLQKTSFIWLTDTKIEGIPCETDIDRLFELISEFVKASEKSVVLLDRLDYILAQNSFDRVIRKVHALKDLTSAHDCIIILSANPEIVNESQLKAIEAETVDLYGKHLEKRIELSDRDMEILRYINDRNVVNKLVSFGDITENFKITKPTTRAKIRYLLSMGLLTVDQKGRFKSVKITSSGRRIIR